MQSYAEKIKEHLGEYRQNKWPGHVPGQWKSHFYEHILAEDDFSLNILETIRADFWKYMPKTLKKHLCFAHLNSSQSLAFNLFFPFREADGNYNNQLAALMGFWGERIVNAEFEKILDLEEFTNFDFWLQFESDNSAVIEVKFTETEFKKAAPNAERLQKLRDIYTHSLKGIVRPEALETEAFFQNYQLLRNLSYAKANPRCTVILLYPRANTALSQTIFWLQENVLSFHAPLIRVVYLEDLVETILAQTALKPLHAHFRLFKEKYLPII